MIKLKKNKRKVCVGAAITIAAVVLLILSVRITEITVTGNKRYTQEQIEGILFQSAWDQNSAYCYYKNRFQEHQKIPFVEDYKIVFRSPTKVEVIIYEKSVVGYVSYMNSYLYFDKDGIIVESASQKLDGIPWITGLQFGHIVLHKPLPVENSKIFEEILNLTQILSVYEIKVDKIKYNSHGEATLTIEDVEVVLGDSSNMSGKIAELNSMLTQLAGLSGTLYLDTYDETNSNLMYTFKYK